MLLYVSTCTCLILLYREIIHADQGYTGTLEDTPFAAHEEGSGEDVLTILGPAGMWVEPIGYSCHVTFLISRQCIKCETALMLEESGTETRLPVACVLPKRDSFSASTLSLPRKSTFDKVFICCTRQQLVYQHWTSPLNELTHDKQNLFQTGAKTTPLCRILGRNSTHNTLCHHEVVGTLLGHLALWLLI